MKSLVWSLLLAGGMFSAGVVMAQASAPLATPVKAGERLSDWLLRNAGPHSDTTALHWRVWAERAPQTRLQQAILDDLSGFPVLQSFFQALPVTGRLRVAIADARWLQAAPAQDPVLQEGHQVILFARPSIVRVLSQTGQPCDATHRAGARAIDYLKACWGSDAAISVDWVWIAQSDGFTQRYGIAPWNREPQAEPGPGAWIWAPTRDALVADSTSDNLVRFLATQSPEVGLGRNPVQLGLDLQADSVALGSAERRPTASDWGEIGLLQSPTARMMPAGDARFQISRVAPYTRGTLMLQPLDWLEAGFRYTDTSNRLYGPDIAGTQSYKDKSLDFKIRVSEETAFWPQIALGVRDLGGTGFFSGEYVVASKRWGEWDASLGVGWGYLGNRRHLRNPLSLLSPRLADRPSAETGQGGVPSLSTMFKGPAALFGGVQWQPVDSPWTWKFELDGNNYQREPQNNNQIARWPFNLGATYTYSPNIDFSLGLERGRAVMVGLTLHGGLNALYAPKLLDPPLPKVSTPNVMLQNQVIRSTAQSVEAFTGWKVSQISYQGPLLTLVAQTDSALYVSDRIERTVVILNRDAPISVEKFRLILTHGETPLTQLEINRAEWLSQRLTPTPPTLALNPVQASPWPHQVQLLDGGSIPSSGSKFDWGPSFGQILGGPDGFVLYQFGYKASFHHALTPSTWITADLNFRLFDNYAGFKYDAPSNMPRVRTDLRKYNLESRLTMPVLQVTRFTQIAQNQYLSLYGGMLESMYGGFGGEWLYRPWNSPFHLGVTLNHVRQRGFAQDFRFKDYSVNTGHLTVSWDTGWQDVRAALSMGQYLAGDRGLTLDLKKSFPNGVSMGAFATKTNVSAEQFGEGSFDKGIYVSIPLDAILPKSGSGYGNVLWRPLTRDGGAMLARKYSLVEFTKLLDSRALLWRENKPAGLISAPNDSYVLSEPAPNLLQSILPGAVSLGHQTRDIPGSSWLWAGSAVLASSLLDKKTDRWLGQRQGTGWSRVGTLGDKLPLTMALGTGLLSTGIAGQDAAQTAELALKAGVYTVGASLLTRYVVGRKRPLEGQGHASFDGFNKSAWQSGFPSNHVALAFALATPYAQRKGANWVYGVAGLTALGRMQSRDHWLSDAVAGGLLGYAIGTMVGMQPSSPKDMRLTATKNSVVAHWPID